MIRRFALVACLVSACATAGVKGVATVPVSPADNPADNPLIIVDGAVQERAVPRPAADTVPCKAAAPLYVVDGLITCRRP